MAAAFYILVGCMLFALFVAIAIYALRGGALRAGIDRRSDEGQPVSVKDPNQVKGDRGERLVSLHHLSQLPPRFYSVFHNVFVPRWDADGTTEIDHVVISPFGFFVIETKAVTGWIFGTEHEVNWTVKNYQATFELRNPLRQNWLHCRSLARFMQVADNTVHSVVFFCGESTFRKEMPVNVLEHDGLNAYICSFQDRVFDEATFQRLASELKVHQESFDSETARQEHLAGIERCLRPGLEDGTEEP